MEKNPPVNSQRPSITKKNYKCGVVFDTETGVVNGIPLTARCVQRLDDSLNMQFTLVIALCYVLHRCENQEIRC